jgi:hypothetical protein
MNEFEFYLAVLQALEEIGVRYMVLWRDLLSRAETESRQRPSLMRD